MKSLTSALVVALAVAGMSINAQAATSNSKKTASKAKTTKQQTTAKKSSKKASKSNSGRNSAANSGYMANEVNFDIPAELKVNEDRNINR